MRVSQLHIINPEITAKNLRKAYSTHKNARIGLRIAILQAILNKEPVKTISERHRITRSQIYKIVQKVNKKGLDGIADEVHKGRPPRLSDEQLAEIKATLLKPPAEAGYSQSRWDGPLLVKLIMDRYNISIKVRRAQYLFHVLGLSLQRGRKEPRKADPTRQEEFKANIKKTSSKRV